jgi:hypothetical protein
MWQLNDPQWDLRIRFHWTKTIESYFVNDNNTDLFVEATTDFLTNIAMDFFFVRKVH